MARVRKLEDVGGALNDISAWLVGPRSDRANESDTDDIAIASYDDRRLQRVTMLLLGQPLAACSQQVALPPRGGQD